MTAFDNSFLIRMRRNRDVLFFALNIFGWTAWGIGQYLSSSIYVTAAEKQTRYHLVFVIGAATGLALTCGLRYACRWLWTQRPQVMIFGALLVAYLAALPTRVAINLSSQYFVGSDNEIEHWYELFMGVTWTSYLFVCWMGIYFSFHYYEANQRERETSLRAMGLAQAAQLKMLRYQLNPHFLFNTLNAISTLVLDQKNAVANTVVTRLADFLRYTLDQDPMKTVTLTQEVTALRLYLDIEKMRFGNRLDIVIDLDPHTEQLEVPSLILQPLIENAIKYAVAPSEQGGRVAITARLDAQRLTLNVDDSGPGLVDTSRVDNGRGVGLRNTRERLFTMYGKDAQIEFVNLNPGLRVSLSLPARANS